MLDAISFNPQELVSDFTIRPVTSPTIQGSASGLILEGNSNRVALVWFPPTGLIDFFVAPFPGVAAGNGWGLVGPNFPVREFVFRDWGSMVGESWFAFNSGFGPASISGLEVIFIPEK